MTQCASESGHADIRKFLTVETYDRAWMDGTPKEGAKIVSTVYPSYECHCGALIDGRMAMTSGGLVCSRPCAEAYRNKYGLSAAVCLRDCGVVFRPNSGPCDPERHGGEIRVYWGLPQPSSTTDSKRLGTSNAQPAGPV